MCCSTGTVDDLNTQIDQKLDIAAEQDRHIKKLLLLGVGESGKSTIFKQLKCLYSDEKQLRDEVYFQSRHFIRLNILLSITKMLRKSQEFFDAGLDECRIDFNDKKIVYSIQCLARFQSFEFQEPMNDCLRLANKNWQQLQVLAQCIEHIWSLDAVQQVTYHMRNQYCIPDNMSYFFDKVDEVYKESYKPSLMDVLKARNTSTGITEVHFTINQFKFNIVDVGGQRNERKKWIHGFQNICAIIFVAALNGYYSVLFEDESMIAMHESIQMFDELINSKWFRQADIVLFLNKNDLFQLLLKSGISLSNCFHPSKNWNGQMWEGPDFDETRILKEINDAELLQLEEESLEQHSSTLLTRKKTTSEDQHTIIEQIGLLNNSKNNYTNNISHNHNHNHDSDSKNNSNNNNSSMNINQRDWRMTSVDHALRLSDFDGNTRLKSKFDECSSAALDFITERYLEKDRRRRKIYAHITTATDITIIKTLFWDVQDIVVRSNLHNTGLLI